MDFLVVLGWRFETGVIVTAGCHLPTPLSAQSSPGQSRLLHHTPPMLQSQNAVGGHGSIQAPNAARRLLSRRHPWTCVLSFWTTHNSRSNDLRGLSVWLHNQLLEICCFTFSTLTACCGIFCLSSAGKQYALYAARLHVEHPANLLRFPACPSTAVDRQRELVARPVLRPQP